jgi:hypothetical protein
MNGNRFVIVSSKGDGLKRNIFDFPTKERRSQRTINQFRNFLCVLSDLAGDQF